MVPPRIDRRLARPLEPLRRLRPTPLERRSRAAAAESAGRIADAAGDVLVEHGLTPHKLDDFAAF